MGSSTAQRIMFTPHQYKPAELLVLLALGWSADEKGSVSTLSIRGLAFLSRVTEKRVKGVLRNLASRGLLSVNPGGGRGRHSVYILNLRIFSKTQRTVAYNGGVIDVFFGAQTDRKIEAFLAKQRGEGVGPLSSSETAQYVGKQKQVADEGNTKHSMKPNSIQRRASRAQRAALERLAADNASKLRDCLDF